VGTPDQSREGVPASQSEHKRGPLPPAAKRVGPTPFNAPKAVASIRLATACVTEI